MVTHFVEYNQLFTAYLSCTHINKLFAWHDDTSSCSVGTMNKQIFVPIFLSFLVSFAHCCSCTRKTDWNEYPHPELVFLGVDDFAIAQSSANTISQFNWLIATVSGIIPGVGTFIGPILRGCNTLREIISGKEDAFSKFIERHLAIATIADIKSKVYTVENRLKEMEMYMEQVQSK